MRQQVEGFDMSTEKKPTTSAGPGDAVLQRMRSLGACPPALTALVRALAERPQRADARVTLQVEGEASVRPRYLLSGWACRLRNLADGRRQVFALVLPGDGVGVCLRPHPLAMSTTVALTPVTLGDAADLLSPAVLCATPELRSVLHAADDLEERRLLDAMTRLGRLTALERLTHLLLELHDRLEVVGLATGGRFPLPVTQEVMADLLGLSTVHINRTLQELRRLHLLVLKRGVAHLPNRADLADITLQAMAG